MSVAALPLWTVFAEASWNPLNMYQVSILILNPKF